MSRTCLEVWRDPAGGRARVSLRSDGPRGRGHVGMRTLSASGNRVRVALVAEGAVLVAGDDVELRMRAGPGVCLDIVEPAGTVAYDMRGGRARWTVTVDVGDAALLRWRGEPFVVSTGAHVDRKVAVTLNGSGVALLRDVLVLGRSREAGGVVRQRCRVLTQAGALLAEDLSVDGSRPEVGVLGGHRVLDQVSVLGRRAPGIPMPPGTHRFELEGEGTVLRALCREVHLSGLHEVWPRLLAPLDGGWLVATTATSGWAQQ